jgi:DtxR family transcriptional regulator, Mn-dependent transcriptional regulator
MASPNEEKFLIEIYHEVRNQGYARVSHLAKSLNVSVSSSSKMIGKLNREELINYQRYGIITLTAYGLSKGKKLASNHQILVQFFRFIGFEEEKIEREVNNIEYYISSDAIDKIKQLLVENVV